jgi:hypothetical protein
MRFAPTGPDCKETPATGNAFRWLLMVLLLLAVSGQGVETTHVAPDATKLVLADPSGAKVRPLADEGQRATLLFFLMHDCPIANSYAPEINRLVKEYSAKKIRCYIVYVESELTAEDVRGHLKDYGFTCGALLDPQHQLVKATGATVSPEAALLSTTGEILYRGRIDDRAAGFGKRRVEPTRRDLRLALDAFLTDQPIPARLTKAVGCYIPESPQKSGQ